MAVKGQKFKRYTYEVKTTIDQNLKMPNYFDLK